MNYFLKKKKWLAWVIMLTFLFTSFMPSNIMAGNSVAEAAISGEKTVVVNKSITLTSEQKNYKYHQWSSDREERATVVGDSNLGWKATVTGKASGEVTITHKYKNHADE